MKLAYKQRLFLYFFILFAMFTTGVIIFERSRERKFRTEALIKKLDAYTGIVLTALDRYPQPVTAMDTLSALLPPNLRLTLIDRQGVVVYDNALARDVHPENHARRPEIIEALAKGSGAHIRTSASNEQKYLYYARRTTGYFIRAALPYDVQVEDFIKSDNVFLYFVAALFFLTLLLINYVADRFGKSIRKLKEFTLSGEKNKLVEFPEDELGEIGRKIRDHYDLLHEREQAVTLEREKLLQHVHSSGEGLCFFSKDRATEFYNGLFIQYLNTITQESTSDPAVLFTDPSFSEIADFLDNAHRTETCYETRIGKQGKFFHVVVNVFEDGGFEVIIDDITQEEKTRSLKQQMTSNIAHELRTPVTSIRGYLEIALEQPLDRKKAREFLSKAHGQTIVLSELIQDMSLITKMEEAPASFRQESIDMGELISSLKKDFEDALRDGEIRFVQEKMSGVTVHGNHNLLYSLFRNLTDNVIRYAGKGVTITAKKYKEDKEYFYFSFADNGVGIPDNRHLTRIFERFYRINEGRTRETGGSGLGLSIVKNAVLLHKGTIVAKNRAEGGLEFLFTLPKKR